MNQISTDRGHPAAANKWAEIAGEVIDKVIGKNMSMTYDFQQLTIDMPKAKDLMAGMWAVRNGQ